MPLILKNANGADVSAQLVSVVRKISILMAKPMVASHFECLAIGRTLDCIRMRGFNPANIETPSKGTLSVWANSEPPRKERYTDRYPPEINHLAFSQQFSKDFAQWIQLWKQAMRLFPVNRLEQIRVANFLNPRWARCVEFILLHPHPHTLIRIDIEHEPE